MSDWDESAGRVSQAFNDWFLIDGDQRAFLRLGLTFAGQAYKRIWDEAGSEPGDPDGPEQIDVFEDRVDGLHQGDYEWMHCSGVLRDAVTNYEIYLEKGREEILRHQGQPIEVPDDAPFWRELKKFYKQIGIDLEADGVEDVRELRHFLTHRRGELRTEELRKRYAADAKPFGPINVELSEDSVLEGMDVLASAVRRVDVFTYRYTWTGAKLPEVESA